MGIESLYEEPDRDEERTIDALEFRDVFRIYGSGSAETVALRGLTLTVAPGEIVALLGPSGSGKSTALHLAAGLDRPSAGDVRAFGRSLVQLTESELSTYRSREIAVVFQSMNLWTDMSAGENIRLALRLARREERIDRVAVEALAAFGLARRADERAGSLSGGEQQRVAIAAAAARRAQLVLADEPTAELDRANEELVLDALARLREQFAATIVVVTHSPSVARAADRVIEIRDGVAA